MKLRLLLTALLLASITCPSVRAAGGHDKDTPLEKEMHAINTAFRQLRKQADDAAQNASSLALVARMEKAAEASAALVPAKAADLPEKDRAAFEADYKAKMKRFGDTLARLEAAFKAGDNAGAVRLLAELNAQKREGHKDFRRAKD